MLSKFKRGDLCLIVAGPHGWDAPTWLREQLEGRCVTLGEVRYEDGHGWYWAMNPMLCIFVREPIRNHRGVHFTKGSHAIVLHESNLMLIRGRGLIDMVVREFESTQ